MEERRIKTLSPNADTIRSVMDKTGWSAYETYVRMIEAKKKDGIKYKSYVGKKYWRTYKRAEAFALFDETVPTFKAKMKYREFKTLFYTDKQIRARKNMRKGKFTLRIICDYLQVELPDYKIENLDYDEDISDRIAFRPEYIKDDCIFFCVQKQFVCPEKFDKVKPAVVIGYPHYKESFEETGISFISCDFLGSYAIDIASFRRKQINAKIIAVTGSVGKSSTKEMIAQAIGSDRKIYKIDSNENTPTQVANHIFRVHEDVEVYIQETSGSAVSALEKSARELRPDVFVITNVGNSHIANFGGMQELLLYEKIACDRHCKSTSVGVINWDDKLLKKTRFKHRIISFAINDASADYYADNIVQSEGEITFDIVEKQSRRIPAKLCVSGEHNVYNALAAFAIGRHFDIDENILIDSIAGFKTRGVRQNLVWLDGKHVYLDFYNSAPHSIKSALSTLDTISVPAGNKKIAVLGDVAELGKQHEEIHREIGKMVAQMNVVDEVIFFGPDMRFAMEEASALGINCRHSESVDEIVKWLKEDTKDNDLLCFKASHCMSMHRFVDKLYGTSYYAEDYATSACSQAEIDGCEFKLIDDYGCALISFRDAKGDFVIPSEVEGYKMRCVCTRAFMNTDLKSVALPEGTQGISKGAFRNCKRLKEIYLPASLEYIGINAFRGCEHLKRVTIPCGVHTIDEFSFANCDKLRRLYIPSNVKTIDENALGDLTKVKVYCQKGSAAYDWAKAKGYRTRNIK